MSSTSLKSYIANGISLNREAAAAALVSAAQDGSNAGQNDAHYVAFSGKSGAITYGRDRADLDEDQQFILEPATCSLGWVCWKDSRPVARHEWSVYQPERRVAEADLEDHGPYRRDQDGWQPSRGFGFIASDASEQYKFSTNSKSGINAVSDMMLEIGKRLSAGEPHYALFRFTKEKFQAQGEWNWKPKFVVDEWLTEGEVADMLSGSDPAQDEEVNGELFEEEPAPRARRTRRA